MVIDVDLEELLQAAQPGAFQPVALQQNYGVVGAVDALGGTNAVRARKRAMDLRNPLRRRRSTVAAAALRARVRWGRPPSRRPRAAREESSEPAPPSPGRLACPT